jgi:tRNA A37 methylthiotransferase MiaB
VVLTGVNLCAWGAKSTNDINSSKFNELLEYILEKTSIPRIRISSL